MSAGGKGVMNPTTGDILAIAMWQDEETKKSSGKKKGRPKGKAKAKPKSDSVNHPDHYAKGRKYEPIDVIVDWELDFCLGSAVKYISRAGRKPGSDPKEDLRKAVWYLEKELWLMETGQELELVP